MCNCHSYNGASGETPEAQLNIAQHFPWMHFTRPIISIDACIAKEVEKLWQMGIYTRGSCCGHGKRRPSICLENPRDIFLTHLFLPRERNFEVLIWKLISV